MNVVYAGNYKVFKGMLLGVMSILKHYDGVLNVYILTMDLTEKDVEYQEVKDEDIALLNRLVQEANEKSKV
ncbi:MAG: hypothetical protein WCY90_03270, partial [Bacilli bacterium]